MLWPHAQRSAKIASPVRPFGGQLASRQSDVIYSIFGSIAPPHLTSRASNGLMPRLVLPISTLAVFTL